MKKNLLPTLLADFYKISHREQYPQGTEVVYSTWIPRKSLKEGIDKVVAFGFQSFISKYLIEYFDEHFFRRDRLEVVKEYQQFIMNTLNIENVDCTHIMELHNLGYLPIEIKALPEGTLTPLRVPMLTIKNTSPKFFWVTNFLETLMSCELWIPSTSATLASTYRGIMNLYAEKTNGDLTGVPFQGHDFSMRGMGGVESAELSGAGHLLSFVGTDTIPAIHYLTQYYNCDISKELVGTSIPATEHSVMCAYGKGNEFEAYKRLITEVYPKGFASIVSDTWDLWKVLDEIIKPLKNEIMARDGRIVVRPDSGNPVDIICGTAQTEDLTNNKYCKTLEDCEAWMKDGLLDELRANTPHGECGDDVIKGIFKFEGKYYETTVEPFWNRYDKQYYYIDGVDNVETKEIELSYEQKGVVEILWDIFGGTITAKGYKQLDTHIGCIYGDAITLERCKEICERLANKGFASTNMVFGIGSFTYQYNTRDTFGFALKSTYAVVDGEERMLFKDPVTDDGTKKSLCGMCAVVKNDKGELEAVDHLLKDDVIEGDLLEIIFLNGKLVKETSLKEIRDRLLTQ